MADKNRGLELLEALKVLIDTELSPADRIIHKPNRKGTGQALKLQLRLKPSWVASGDSGYFDKDANKDGGLFLEIASQVPGVGPNATFNWRGEDLVRCKLGVPDQTALLLAIRTWRQLGQGVPESLRPKAGQNAGAENQVSLFHKTKTGNTVITYEFREADSILQVSHSDGRRRSIALGLQEELLFQRYLELALDAHLRVGKR